MAYIYNGRQFHAVFPRHKLWRVYATELAQIPADAPEVTTRSVVTMRFSIRGSSAQEALEEHIKSCEEALLECLNKINSTIVAITKAKFPTMVSPLYDESTFDSFHLIIRGADPCAIANWRMVSSLRQGVRRPLTDFDSDATARMRAALSGMSNIDDITKMIHSARCYAEGGLLEFALLQLMIAAEIGTGRFVNQITKRKARSDASFATMLNTEVSALCPAAMKPDPSLLKRIDAARKLRNKLMHEATLRMTRERIYTLHDDVQSYIDHLNSVLKRRGFMPLTTG
jgi:hypothetical protein